MARDANNTGCADEAAVLAANVKEEIEPEVLMISELSGALGVSWCSLPQTAAL